MAFNLKKFSEDEGHRRDRIQQKIVDFFHEMSPVDSNAYLSPDAKKVTLSLGDSLSDEYDKYTDALRDELKDEDVEVEECDECGCPEKYQPYSGIDGFSRRSILSFVCTACGHECLKPASECPACTARFFRVARREVPIIQNPQKNPYRDKSQFVDNSDGYQFTTPGGQGDISGSGFGENSRPDQTGHDELMEQHGEEREKEGTGLPTDQDAFDPYASRDPDSGIYDQPASPALTDDDSPLNPINNPNEPKHVGPFNMPHNSRVPSIYNAWKGRSVYDRIINKTKGN